MHRFLSHLLVTATVALVAFALVASAVLFSRSHTLKSVRRIDSKIIRSLVEACAHRDDPKTLDRVQDAFSALTSSSGRPFYGLALIKDRKILATNLTASQIDALRAELYAGDDRASQDPRLHFHKLSPDGNALLAELRTERAFDFDGPLAFLIVPLRQWFDSQSPDVSWSVFRRKAAGPALISLVLILALGIAYRFALRSITKRHERRLQHERRSRIEAIRRAEATLRQTEGELDRVRQEKEDYEEQYRQADDERRALMHNLDQSQHELETTQNLLDETTSTYEARREELDRLEQQLDEREARLEEARAEIARRRHEARVAANEVAAREARLQDAERAVDEMRRDAEQAAADLTQRRQSLETSRRLLADKEQQLDTLERRVHGPSSLSNTAPSEGSAGATDAQEQKRLREEVQRLRQDQLKQSQELQRSEEELASKERELERLKAAHDDHHARLASADSARRELESRVTSLEKERSEAESALQQRRKESERHRRELQDAENEVERLQAETAHIGRAREAAEQRLHALEQAREDWEREQNRRIQQLQDDRRAAVERVEREKQEALRLLSARLKSTERERAKSDKKRQEAESEVREWMELAQSYAEAGPPAVPAITNQGDASREQPQFGSGQQRNRNGWKDAELRCGTLLKGMESMLKDTTVDVRPGHHHSREFVKQLADSIAADPVSCRIVKRVTSHAYSRGREGQIFLERSPRDPESWFAITVARKTPYAAQIEFVATSHWQAALLAHVLRVRLKTLHKAEIRVQSAERRLAGIPQ